MNIALSRLSANLADFVRILDSALSECKNPVLMFSGGKDSTVLLHIIRFQLGVDMPVIFHRTPFEHQKYLFALKLLSLWRVSAFDYPPFLTTLTQRGEHVGFTSHFLMRQFNSQSFCFNLTSNIIEPKEGEGFLCGKTDILMRPTGSMEYRWDGVVIGHKSSDQHDISGPIPLKDEIIRSTGNPTLVFPLRNWTDEDIWTYLDRNQIPVDQLRYDRISRKENPDKKHNPDAFHACIRCLDRRLGSKVTCPLLNEEIDNISAQVPYREIKLDYFGE